MEIVSAIFEKYGRSVGLPIATVFHFSFFFSKYLL